MSESASEAAHKIVYIEGCLPVEVPLEDVADWRNAVANDETTKGLLDFHLDRAMALKQTREDDEDAALRTVLLAVIEPITHRGSPARVARFIIDRPSIEKKLSLANRETLLLALEDLMSQPHTNDQVADTVLEYLDK